jgi:DNA polymerase-3 subunit gamma/tau
MFLKGIAEIQQAPSPLAALEMVLIRLAHLSDLPSPTDALKMLQSGGTVAAAGAAPAPSGTGPTTRSIDPTPTLSTGAAATVAASINLVLTPVSGGVPTAQTYPLTSPAASPASITPEEPVGPSTFEEIVALFAAKREAVLHAKLVQTVRPVRVELGILEITGDPEVNEALAGALGKMLIEWTGRPWSVTLSQDIGAPTLLQRKDAVEAQMREEVSVDPVVAAVLGRFPGASVEAVRPLVPSVIGEAETLVDPFMEEDDDDDMEARVNEG